MEKVTIFDWHLLFEPYITDHLGNESKVALQSFMNEFRHISDTEAKLKLDDIFKKALMYEEEINPMMTFYKADIIINMIKSFIDRRKVIDMIDESGLLLCSGYNDSTKGGHYVSIFL